MKKLMSSLLVLLCLLGLVACSQKDTAISKSQTEQPGTVSTSGISENTPSAIHLSQTPNIQIASLTIPDKEEILKNGYPINKYGETYGPDIWEWDYSPDLLLVQNEEGILGYIRVSELENNPPKSPNDLDKYEQVCTLNMYLEDGITIIGEFRLD